MGPRRSAHPGVGGRRLGLGGAHRGVPRAPVALDAAGDQLVVRPLDRSRTRGRRRHLGQGCAYSRPRSTPGMAGGAGGGSGGGPAPGCRLPWATDRASFRPRFSTHGVCPPSRVNGGRASAGVFENTYGRAALAPGHDRGAAERNRRQRAAGRLRLTSCGRPGCLFSLSRPDFSAVATALGAATREPIAFDYVQNVCRALDWYRSGVTPKAVIPLTVRLPAEIHAPWWHSRRSTTAACTARSWRRCGPTWPSSRRSGDTPHRPQALRPLR